MTKTTAGMADWRNLYLIMSKNLSTGNKAMLSSLRLDRWFGVKRIDEDAYVLTAGRIGERLQGREIEQLWIDETTSGTPA